MNPVQVVDHLVDHGFLDRRGCLGNFLRHKVCALAGQLGPGAVALHAVEVGQRDPVAVGHAEVEEVIDRVMAMDVHGWATGMTAAGLDLETAFGAVLATINLLGPGLGEVSTSFATMSPAVKWLAMIGMLVGRLEVFTLLVLFTPMFWRI